MRSKLMHHLAPVWHPLLRAIHLATYALILAEPLQAQLPRTRDSSGVEIVTNTRPVLATAQAWRVDPRPLLEIGATDAATAGDSLYEFSLIMGVTRLRDQRLAVAVQGSHTIRFFDARGRFVGSAGRRGDGPGEFQQVLGLANTPGDTLVVMDLGEVELFTGEGRFVGQGASRRTRAGNYIWPGAVLADRSYLGLDFNDRTIPPAGRSERRVGLMHVSADGNRVDTVATLLLQEALFDGRTPWGNDPVYAPQRLLAASGQRVFTSYPNRYEIAELTPDGRPIRLIRREMAQVPVRGEERDAYRRHLQSQPGEDGRPMTPAMRSRFEQVLTEAGFATSYPSIGVLLPDRAGNLWARHFDYRERLMATGPVRVLTIPAPTTWDVFDARGTWLTTVELPAHFTPLEIGTDYIAGIARDADDVESVRVLRLRKP